jgi:hypothetical protein
LERQDSQSERSNNNDYTQNFGGIHINKNNGTNYSEYRKEKPVKFTSNSCSFIHRRQHWSSIKWLKALNEGKRDTWHHKKTAQHMSGLQPSNPHHPAFCITLSCDARSIGTTHPKSAWVSIYSRLWLHCVKL